MIDLIKSKDDLRKDMMRIRKNYSADQVFANSTKVCDYFFKHVDLSTISIIHSYVPLERTKEVNVKIIWNEIWKRFPSIKICVPRIIRDSYEMEHIVIDSKSVMQKNELGIEEPILGDEIKPELIDLVLIPTLACDFKGNRIGYGKGFYDRFLAKCKPDCNKIGISHESIDSSIIFKNDPWGYRFKCMCHSKDVH